MAFLEIKGLKKRFGFVEILKGIDIELDKGASWCWSAPRAAANPPCSTRSPGSKRSARAISGSTASRSTACILPSATSPWCFQSYALYPNMTVAGNIAFGMEMRGVPKPERDKAIAAVAKTLQIGHLLDRRPSQLSGGQRQRVAMGRALVRDPRVFLFDEPLSNLDAKLRVDMRTEIKRLHATTGTTVVYVTHDQIEAMTLATKIAVLKDGEVQQVGTPAEIYNKPNNLFVADFMGSPAMNLLTARVVEENGRTVLKLARPGQQDVTLAPPNTIAAGPLPVGRDLILGIRPEAITDRDGADRNSRAIELVEGYVDVVEPAGSDTFVVTQIGGKHVTARMRSDVAVTAGSTMPFAFNLDKAVVFDPESGRRM